MSRRKKKRKNKKDSDGLLWQIREVYVHKAFSRAVGHSLYMQLQALKSDARMSGWMLEHNRQVNTKVGLRRLYRHSHEELLHGVLSIIYLGSLITFRLQKVLQEESAHYVAGSTTGRVCPHCHSKECGCLYSRFWEKYSLSQSASTGSWLQVRKCRETKKLFIYEHPNETLILDGVNIKSVGSKYVHLIDNNGNLAICPVCENEKFILDSSKLWFRCSRDNTPLLIFDKNNVDDLLSYESYAKKIHERNTNLERFLKGFIVTCDIPYNDRPIEGPPFSVDDLRLKEAGFCRPLKERQSEFARGLPKLENRQVIESLKEAKRFGCLRFYREQRKKA